MVCRTARGVKASRRQRAPSGQDQIDVICLEANVPGYDRQALALGLTDQKSVEGVSVMQRQPARGNRVHDRYGKIPEVFARTQLLKIVRKLKLPKSLLDFNFPGDRSADENHAVVNCLVYPRQAWRVLEPP